MAEWQSIELADSDTLEALGKYGTEAITKINTALDVVKGGAEIGKLFLMTAVNPVAVAIVIAADEMISVLGQYKESGISILIIDPTDTTKGPSPDNKLGLQILHDNIGAMFEISYPHISSFRIGGERIQIDSSYTVNDEYRKSIDLLDLDADWRDKNGRTKGFSGFIPPIPVISFPPTFAPGGYNPETWTGTVERRKQHEGKNIKINAFGVEEEFRIPGIEFPELPADQTIEMMAAAFEDKGDIPKYKITNTKALKYFDKDGAEVKFLSASDKVRDQRLELYASANTKKPTIERTLLTKRIATGRPEYSGDTGSLNFQVSALAIIVAAQDPLKFIESLANIVNTLMPDHDELMKSIDAFTDSLTFYGQNLTLRVDTDYGDFVVGDIIIGEKSGCIGEIQEIVSQESSIMTSVIVESNQHSRFGRSPPPQPPVIITEKTVDRNPNGKFQDVVIKWLPMGTSHRFGKFNPRENVFEGVKSTQIAVAVDGTRSEYIDYRIKEPPIGWEHNLRPGVPGKGLLPKWSTVKAQSSLAEASIPPNFSSAKLAQMIPEYGEFFDGLINVAEKLKAFAEGVLAAIQALIDIIDKAVEFFEELAENIIALIKLLTQGIPNAGIWFMGMSTTSGNNGLAAGLRNAANAPDSSYTFSGGILLVGPVMTGSQTEDMNKKLWEMLGIEFQSV